MLAGLTIFIEVALESVRRSVPARSSLLAEVLELRLRLLLAGRDVALVIDIDQTFVLKLVDDVPGVLVLLRHLIKLSQLLLCSSQFCELGLDVGFFLGSGFPVSLYLRFGSPSLTCLLEEVGADALTHWEQKIAD